MPFFRRDAVSPLAVRNAPDGSTPAPDRPGASAAIRDAYRGISVELARLPWDWRERQPKERALDEWSALERIADPVDRLAAKFAHVNRARA